MLDTIYSQIGTALTLIVCAFAFWKGGRIEQWGAGAVLLAQALTILLQDNIADEPLLLASAIMDGALLTALAVLAWRSDHGWPSWAAACQAIAVAVHVTKLVDFRIVSFAYSSALNLSFYGVLVALGVGTFFAWREREALRPG